MRDSGDLGGGGIDVLLGGWFCCVGWMSGVSDGAGAVGRCNDECAFWRLSV